MNTHSDPIEQLLEQQGEHWRSTFVPPALDGMLAVATAPAHRRSRWVWPLVAAIALLVIPLATVVAVHGSHRSPAPTASQPTAQPIGLLGSIRWFAPILQTDGRTVTVEAYVNATPRWCLDFGIPIVRGLVVETATTVTITAQAFRPADLSPTPSVPSGSVLGCTLIGRPPMPMSVPLKRPLGNRTLIDATSGIHYPVFLASTVPTPSYLPAGYVDRGFRWQDAPSSNPNQVLHAYAGPGGELRVVRGRGQDTFSPYDPLFITGEVLGHPTRLLKSSTSGTCLTWRDSEYWWGVCSVAATLASELSTAELLRIGNSIR
jgi:hypothetical protein